MCLTLTYAGEIGRKPSSMLSIIVSQEGAYLAENTSHGSTPEFLRAGNKTKKLIA